MVKEILRCTHLDFESVELFDGLGSVVLIGKIDEHISGVVTDRLELVYLQAKLLERGLPMKTVAALRKSELGIMVAAGYLIASKKV